MIIANIQIYTKFIEYIIEYIFLFIKSLNSKTFNKIIQDEKKHFPLLN